MAARAKRTTQPAAVTSVDWGNPITRSLVAAFSAGGGTNPVDATNFRPWARQYGDDFQLAPSLDGYALVNGASVNYKVTSPVSMTATAGQTVVVVVTPLASITVENPFAQADNGGWYAGTMYVGDGTNPRFAAGGWSGSAQRATAPTDYVLKQRYVVASRVNPSGTLDLFIDGVLVASNSATIGNLSYARPLVIRSPSNTAKSIAFGGAAGFSRALSDLEIKSLSDNFWQIFASPSRGRRFAAAAATGATYTLTAASGSFALTGQAAALNFNRILSAASGSLTLSGQTAALKFNRTLSASSGGFTLSGQAATLAFNRAMLAASGSFSLSGQDAALKFNRALSAGAGSFALTGQPATLTYTPVTGATYTLVANSGSFSLAGQNAELKFNRVLAAYSGSFALTGQNVTFGMGSQANDLALILKILSNRQELNPATGKFTIYDNDGVSVLYQANAWADAAGTVPYSGGALRRIDALA